MYISTAIIVPEVQSELLAWSLLKSLDLPVANHRLHLCDWLTPGFQQWILQPCVLWESRQHKTRRCCKSPNTGRKLAWFYLLSPWQHTHHLNLLSSHFTKKAQIGVTAQFWTVAIWRLPRLFQNTDSLFTLLSGSSWTPGTDTESASNVLKQTYFANRRERTCW